MAAGCGVCCAYSVQLRRKQLGAVEIGVESAGFSGQQKDDMEKLTADGLVAQALASGDVNSVRDALKKNNLDKQIDVALNKCNLFNATFARQRNLRSPLIVWLLFLVLYSQPA